MKKFLAILISVLMVFQLAACSGSTASQESENSTAVNAETKSEQTQQAADAQTGEAQEQTEEAVLWSESDETLKVVLDIEPAALYTQFGSMTTAVIVTTSCLYDYLVYWDNTAHDVVPGIAESWENVDEYRWRFHLKEGVTTAKGTPFTAEDVLYTFKVGCDGPDVSSYSRLFDIDNFEVEDDYTIIIATLSVAPKLPEVLTKSCYAMLSKADAESSGGIEAQQLNPQCGTGKYVLDSWVSGQKITMVRNENYWNKENDPVYFKSVEFTFVGDAATRMMSLQSKEADFVYGLTSAQIQSLESDPSVDAYANHTPGAEVVSFNCGAAPFDNEDVRKAVCMLIDPLECMTFGTGGLSDVTNSMLGTTNKYYSAPAYDHQVDIAQAKSLLAGAGYANGLTIDLQYSSNSPVYEVIQRQLAEGGVTLNLIPVEYATLKVAQRNGEYAMTIGPIKTADIVQTFMTLDARVGYTLNAGGCQCSDQELYDLLDAVYHEFDEAKSAEGFAKIQDYVREHNIAIGLYDTLTYAAVNSEYTAPNFDLAGSFNLSYIHSK